jgi:hypothetical protein
MSDLDEEASNEPPNLVVRFQRVSHAQVCVTPKRFVIPSTKERRILPLLYRVMLNNIS